MRFPFARRSLANSRVLITGASSGIGEALSLQMASHGARLLITARRKARLDDLAIRLREYGGIAEVVAGDITDDELRAELLAAARDRLGGVDILVNNAGVGAIGDFRDASSDRLRKIMEVNFFAPLELIRAALPLMEAGDQPTIVNVSSVLGHRAVPGKSEYCASKFALHGFSDALRCELADRHIEVLLVSPSTTQSEFFDQVLDGHQPIRKGAMTADSVAKSIVVGIQRGRQEIILSWGGRLLVWLDRLCPPLAGWIVKRGEERGRQGDKERGRQGDKQRGRSIKSRPDRKK